MRVLFFISLEFPRLATGVASANTGTGNARAGGKGSTKGTAFNIQASSTASANSLKFGAICNRRDRLLSIDLIEDSLILSFRSQCLKVDICTDIKSPGSPYQEVFLVDTKGRVDYSATIRRLAGWDSPACLRRINSFIGTFKRKVLQRIAVNLLGRLAIGGCTNREGLDRKTGHGRCKIRQISYLRCKTYNSRSKRNGCV